jgi:hypothetical protein
MKTKQQPQAPTHLSMNEKRRADALRENLRKRKEQQLAKAEKSNQES